MSGEGEGEPPIHGVPPGADNDTIGGPSTGDGAPVAEEGGAKDDNNHDNDNKNDDNNDTTPTTNNNGTKDGWEAARAWLWTLPRRRNVMRNEIEAWLQANKHTLSREIVTMPRLHLYRFLVSQHKLIRRTKQPISPARQHEEILGCFQLLPFCAIKVSEANLPKDFILLVELGPTTTPWQLGLMATPWQLTECPP